MLPFRPEKKTNQKRRNQVSNTWLPASDSYTEDDIEGNFNPSLQGLPMMTVTHSGRKNRSKLIQFHISVPTAVSSVVSNTLPIQRLESYGVDWKYNLNAN